MRIHRYVFLSFVLGCLLTGCIPSERFWWSPNGDKVAVVIEGQLRITDSTGENFLIPEFPEVGEEESIAEYVGWTGNGETLITHRIRGFRSWSLAKPEFPADDVRRIEELAEAIPSIARAAIALGGDADNVDSLLARLRTREPDYLRNAFYLSYERNPETLLNILSELPKLRSKIETESDESGGYLLNQLDVVHIHSDGTSDTSPLLKSTALLSHPVLSPDDSRVLIGRRRGEKALIDLVSITIDDRSEIPVAKRVFPTYAWQGDQSVFALSPVTDSEGLLKQLKRFSMSPEGESTAETLATALIPFLPRLELLPDGSVLFASQTGMLPAVTVTTPPESALIRYLPETGELVRVPTPEGALPMNLGFFKASPDGKRVAVVESDTDAVAVVEISSGKVDLISKPHPNSKCRTLPAWKSSQELSFARLNEARRIEWVLWNLNGETRILNSDWSSDLTANWIEIDDSNNK